jgi:tryptophan 2,3-dioxygenase
MTVEDDVVGVVQDLYRGSGRGVAGPHLDASARDLDPRITVWESDTDRMLHGVAELRARDERAARSADGPALVAVAPEDVRAEVWDDTAVARYLLRAHYPKPAADRCYRVTDVLRRTESGWRVVHHHAEALSLLDRTAPPHAGKRLTYGGYLRLDELLACQSPLTDAHDELLFVIIHHVYELWFAQILHEAGLLQRRLEGGDSAGALHTARRIAKILKTVVGQLDVLETMTPKQFASFRPELGSASGFQSNQFRELEAVLGRRDYPESALDERLVAAIGRRSVFDSLLRYLVAAGFPVPDDVLDRDPSQPWRARPDVRAVLARVYADETNPAAEVCEALVDVDEGVQEWRYRHVKMVERIIGGKLGTGGSTGADYLRSTLFRAAFPDLWEVRGVL